jgi:ribosomal protein L7Ae-like RNA K-turn-binding protein
MMNRKICSLLGLAMRAGKLKVGEDAVLQAIRGQQAQLVIVATDASPATRKKVSDKCKYYQVPWVSWASREQLGACVGKDERVLLAVIDTGFARSILHEAENEKEVDSVDER